MFRSLQGITKFRLQLIEAWCGPFSGKCVIDLGCGGGLLAVPVHALNADVVGLDLSGKSLAAARAQAGKSKSLGAASFLLSDFRRTPLRSGIADVVLLADVLDHVSDYKLCLAEAARLLKTGGRVYVSTINRNLLSWLLAIVLGENLGLVPKGTHDHRLFIRPRELEVAANLVGLRVLSWQGEKPHLRKTLRNWAIHFAPTRSLSVAYSVLLQRGEDFPPTRAE